MMKDLYILDMDDFCGCLGLVNNVFWMVVCWGGVFDRGGGDGIFSNDGFWVSRFGGWRGIMSYLIVIFDLWVRRWYDYDYYFDNYESFL